MGKLKEKIFNYYNSLNNKSKLLLIIGTIFVLAIFYYSLVANNYRNSEINYKDLSTEKIISNSEVVYNRGTIREIDGIIGNLSDIYFNRLYINEKKVTLKKLYNAVLTENYKKDISYKEFEKRFNNIFECLYGSGELKESVIDLVYYSSEYEMYLVKLNVEGEELYLGFDIHISGSRYSIVYIQ